MMHPTELPAHVLVEIVSQIQQLLWLDTDPTGDFWNGDKEWDCETIEYIAAVLDEHGLRPGEAVIEPTITVDWPEKEHGNPKQPDANIP